MTRLAPLAFATLLAASVSAQTTQFTDPANLRGERIKPRDGRELPIDQGSRGLQQLLRKLNTRASMMLIVAHPDDEDGGMLTFYSRGLGARVAMLTLNRGEGGQNAMTGDFEDALGLLRTQELLAADRYLGVDQMFGTEVDFGFSKTKEEAFSKWTHERVLYDAVRAVRLYRPLVIASVFIGGVTDGHGQHQVAGEIAQEVFKAAGDPKIFPELTAEGILPWQPLKVYARVPVGAVTRQGLFDYATGQYAPARFTNYVTGEVTNIVPSEDVIIHEGQTDPLLADTATDGPLSYVQFARVGLGLQRSQIGPGVRSTPSGAFDLAYHRYASTLAPAQQKDVENNFFDGIDVSLESIAPAGSPPVLVEALQGIAALIQQAETSFQPEEPSRSAPALAEAFSQVRRLVGNLDALGLTDPGQKETVRHELSIKAVQLNNALALALGLTFDASTHDSQQLAGSTPVITTELRSSSGDPLDVSREWLENSVGALRESESTRQRAPEISADRPFTRTFRTSTSIVALKPGEDDSFTTIVSRPYFERATVEDPVYRLRTESLRNAPTSPAALTAWVTVDYKGLPLTVGRVVHDGAQPLAFIPAASLTLPQHAQVVIAGTPELQLSVHVDTAPAGGDLRLRAPSSWSVHPGSQPLTAGDHEFRVSLPDMPAAPILRAEAATHLGDVESEGYRPVGYGDLPRTNFYTPATVRIVPIGLKLPIHKRIAYLPGTGDAVPEALASIDLPPTAITVADLTPAGLAAFDTVVLGVRTYNAHPDLHGAPTQALLDFARSGGNVVVQYQTGEFTGADAPYPLSLGRDAEKVVDETAPVHLLDPASLALSSPNKLTEADFNGWIEERGHGFLRSWDPQYTALTETHDPGSASEGVGPQAPQQGGLVTVQFGKGHWTYCAFALYRQLPEAVQGSFRLFSNLLALADKR